MNEELKAIDVVDDVLKIVRRGRFAEITLKNGIVLGLKPLPPLLTQAIGARFQTPKPPKMWIEEKGREEENPNDPEYLRELQRIEDEQDLAVNDLVMGAGTHVISVPEGYFMPEEKGWEEPVLFACELSGVELHIDDSSPTKRYLCWLRFYALETAADVALVSSLPLQLGGIREGEVDAAMESFHGVSSRRTNIENPSETGSENGNTQNRAGRRAGARNRRTRSSDV